MLDIICDINVCLKDCASEKFKMEKLKFLRRPKDYMEGDLSCVIPADCKNEEISAENFKRFIEEKMPWLLKFVNFQVTERRVNLYLTRDLSYIHGLINIRNLKDQYGSNGLFNSKVIKLTKAFIDQPVTLNDLRIQKVFNVLSLIIEYCGGTILTTNLRKDNALQPDLQLLITTNSKRFSQEDIIVLVGSVIGGKNCATLTSISAEQYQKMRLDEIELMCKNKLESNMRMECTNDLVTASISFDMLQSNITKTMALHLGDQNIDKKSSCKGSMFVLYNFARLLNIISKFHESVEKTIYPPLPPIEDTDFSLLVQDEEWNIMFDFILSWPNIVKQSVENLVIGRPKVHLLFKFLISLSTNFSLYYHRTKILTEPRSHLIPVLHARMQFLLGLVQVYKNALLLASLKPLNQM